jgi:hypothetical protein
MKTEGEMTRIRIGGEVGEPPGRKDHLRMQKKAKSSQNRAGKGPKRGMKSLKTDVI